MTGLKYTTDSDGFALLETEHGYLQYFRGYRIQLSATAEGIGDNGSSNNINGHFSNIEADCSDEASTKFVNLVGLAHVYEAVKRYPEVIKQIKTDTAVFEEFMCHLLETDFNQRVNSTFSVANTLANVKEAIISDHTELENLAILAGREEGSIQVYVGTKGTEVFVIDAITLKGHSIDFKEFASFENESEPKLTGYTIEFAKTITLDIASFIEEYPLLYSPNFYVNHKRNDLVGAAVASDPAEKSNIFHSPSN